MTAFAGFKPDYAKESETWLRRNIERHQIELEGLRIAEGAIRQEIDEKERSISEMVCELLKRMEVSK